MPQTPSPRRRPSARELLGAVGGYVRSAPGTFVWLAILGVTAAGAHLLTPDQLHALLGRHSTNLANLETRPVRALVTSAFFFDGGTWWAQVVWYSVFHAQAERWLGTWRWLTVVVIGHVGATYLSQGLLAWLISVGRAQPELVDTLDFGVSYALAAVMGVLAYRVPRRWRPWYVVAALAGYLAPFAFHVTFTTVGHLTALLLGFACLPLARRRAVSAVAAA